MGSSPDQRRYRRISLEMDEGSFSIEAAMLLKVICWLSPCSMIIRSDRVICLRLPLEISVTRSSILHRQESRVEYSMGVSWDNIALCIKLCKSNFYWVEFSDTQVEVRILLNVRNITREKKVNNIKNWSIKWTRGGDTI